jgi:predicted Zn-ribbon and HTH transcriptional regulator
VYGSSGSPGDVLERTSPDPRIAAFEHIRAEIADWLAVRPATAVRFLGQLVEHDEAKSAEAVVNVVKALRRYSDDLEKAPRRCTVCGAPHDEHGRRVLVP